MGGLKTIGLARSFLYSRHNILFMYKIILGVIVLCYGFYTLLTGDYVSGGDKFIESFGSAFVLIIIGWSLFWSGLDKDKAFIFKLLKDSVKKINFKLLLTKINLKVITLIVVGLGLFYWFQYRPSEIRKICYQEVMKSPGYFEARVYQGCLNGNGITK
jgi:hypothetical protein